jgi:Tfp pilus assembly protein PilE
MESVVVGMAVLAIVGYGLYKIFVKKETVAEAVAEVKVEAAAVETKIEDAIKVEVAKVVEEVKAVEAKVEEVVVAEVKKAKARVKKAADVNEDGKVDVADVVAAVKKGGRPKKSA